MVRIDSQSFNDGCGRHFDMEGGSHQFNEYVECEWLVNFAKTIAYFLLKYEP